MAHFELDELEQDEIFHALTERKGTLDARVKSLSEKDGLPEAADAVRKRIGLYMPSGEDGRDYRSGLIRLFAPQRDLDAERQAGMHVEERDPNGGQDLFGGGAETGGGIPAGRKEKRKKKGEPELSPTSLEDPIAQATADPVALALDQLAALAADLLKGDPKVEPEIFRGYAVPVIELLPRANPALDRDVLVAMVNGDLGGMADNAHALAYFIQRNVDSIRDAREKPIGRREEAHSDPATSEATVDGDAGVEGSRIPDPTLEGVNVGSPEAGPPETSPTSSDTAPDAGADRAGQAAGLSFAPVKADKKGKPKR